MARFDPQSVLDALTGRADGQAALALTGARVAVVGGFVRDVLLGREPRELDLVIEGDLRDLARQLGGAAVVHEPFMAVHVARDGWAAELTHARRERYASPGALPSVEPTRIEEDLPRRDFSVNAIAVTLGDGELLAPPGAVDDLAAGRLRVLHPASFIDDPTRVLRLARYARRTGFSVERETGRLAEEATLATVSGARIGAELTLILREPDPLGILEDLQGKLPITVERETAECALELAPADADSGLVILAATMRHQPPDERWIDSLELGARAREVVMAAGGAQALADTIAAVSLPSQMRSLTRGIPVEVLAIAGALGPREAVARWLGDLRHVALEIGGEDLLAAGVPEGPALGALLERTLERKLDGTIAPGRAAELASALEEQR
jgi:tRNA nucleotidyltransferase (CCA-adding enzyme)